MAEIDHIKKERVEERLRKKVKQQQMEELNAKEEKLFIGNPLLNNTAALFSVKRSFLFFWWDNTVVFESQARGEMKAPYRFINDTIKNDFHSKFLH
ncbi:unnamed protein product [Eruca vesicaria subsp. sativa]|uniref:Uncharacterized protein n=1 Tax=Eruca vesicaria subsp. sativa TaxID=29727 RepID=A0ABC8KKZ8_ERUVS|nr:unnamed protein product [Eruca vesicaria subsp. sativa]